MLEELEDVDDTRVLNVLKGFRDKKVVPRFREKYDTKRYKAKYNNRVGDSEVEFK
jgi:hypothetical protein